MILKLPTYELLKYFRDNKKNTNWPIIIFLETGVTFAILKVTGNFDEQIASLITGPSEGFRYWRVNDKKEHF